MQKIKIKLNRTEVTALRDFFLIPLNFMEPDGFNQMIILELMWEVTDRMDRMINNVDQKRFTLSLSGSQSMAFMAFTNMVEIERFPYEQVLVHRIVEEIDRKRKSIIR